MGSKLIAYECISPGHKPGTEHPDKLTIHDGRWAFCGFGARADGHEWRATGGEDLAALMRKVGLTVIAPGSDIDSGRRAPTRV